MCAVYFVCSYLVQFSQVQFSTSLRSHLSKCTTHGVPELVHGMSFVLHHTDVFKASIILELSATILQYLSSVCW